MDLSQFDPNQVIIGGVLLLPLIFGFVQFLKEVFKMQGTAVTVMSFFIGVGFMALVQVAEMYPDIGKWIIFGVLCLTVGLSASGHYKFATRGQYLASASETAPIQRPNQENSGG